MQIETPAKRTRKMDEDTQTDMDIENIYTFLLD